MENKISIIIPVYNIEKYIEECVKIYRKMFRISYETNI